jgi:mRNA interferase MazF
MPPTTSYKFGDVVLVPFPFTDQTGEKKRPAVVVSSERYQRSRPDVIIMAVTSQIRPSAELGEVPIPGWKKAGLLKPSVTKPVLATVEQALVLRKLGRLSPSDRAAVLSTLHLMLG